MKIRKNFLLFILVLGMVSFGAVSSEAQVKKQLFAGVGTIAGRNGSSSSVVTSAGFALAIPLNKHIFIRPVGSIGLSNPISSNQQSFPVIQASGLLGLKLTPVFSVLGGGGYNFGFPKDKPTSHLPTAIISAAAKLSDHMIMLAPIAINEKGVGTSIQLGFYW